MSAASVATQSAGRGRGRRVYSPFGAQAPGMARLRDLGSELVHCKGIYYDWSAPLEGALAFRHDNPRFAEPPGFSL